MDIAAPLGGAGASGGPVDDPLLTSDPTPTPTDAAPSVAQLQADIAELSRRVDALAGTLDASVRTAVAEEVQRVAGELQHTVAALGRVLVRDLGKLNQILTQHRDAILAEVRGKPAGRTGAAATPTSTSPDLAPPDQPPDVAADADDGTTDDDEGPSGPAERESQGQARQRRWRKA